MPIKFPKGFARRKSSGNILEEVSPSETNKRESTFRVLSRNEVRHDFGGSDSNKGQSGVSRPSSQPLYGTNSSFGYSSRDRVSATNNSSSTGENASDPRRSYASTTASSVNYDSDDMDTSPSSYKNFNSSQTSYSQQRPPQPPPQTYQSQHSHSKSSFSIKAGGRTFSFGPKAPSANARTHSEDDVRKSGTSARQRAATQTSMASTTTPPKLDLAPGLGLGLEDSDFDRGLGTGRLVKEPTPVMRTDSDPLFPVKSYSLSRTRSYESGVERLDVYKQQSQLAGASPNSQSDHSSDKLIGSPPVPEHKTSLRSVNESPAFEDTALMLDALHASQALELQHAPPPVPKIPASYASQPRPSYNTPVSPPPHRNIATPPFNTYSSRGEFVNGPSTAAQYGPKSPDTDDNIFDSPKSTITARPHPIPQAQPPPPRASTPGANKVMTGAEFEEYKHRKEMAGDEEEASEASEESDDYEDDDEQEKQRQMAKQRRRQDAHLAVYRQQMKKVTGEQSDLPSEPSRFMASRATMSTGDLSNSLAASLTFNSVGQAMDTKSSEDEDEDVPLGVLQAHGFPSKTRPPARMANGSASSIQRPGTSLSAYPAPPGSTRNDASAGGGGNGNLPVFARNLPQDPYLGASLVNPSNREPLQYHSGAASSGPVPPGGLIGVIAGEERAKAMRRGSPNTQGTYGQLPPSMGFPQQMAPLQPAVSAEQQAQMQMNQQMAHMMQMQMQWMQQMMQMNGGGQGMPQMPGMPPMMPGMMPQMPGMAPQMPGGMGQQMPMDHMNPTAQHFLSPGQRPPSAMSGAAQARPAPFGAMPQQGFGLSPSQASMHPQANMNMYGASTAGSVYGLQPGYAPSLAPSERSNVGQPSRYRPVNNTGSLDQGRPATASPDPAYMASNRGRSVDLLSNGPGTTIRAVSRPRNTVPSDDEDEEGWAAMKKKRAERKSRVFAKKSSSASTPKMSSPSIAATAGTASTGSSTAQGAGQHEVGGMEGLYYDGPYNGQQYHQDD